MRINEERIYKMYLNDDEFALMYGITNMVPYDYYYVGNDETGEFIITVKGEYNLEKIKELLNNEIEYQKYEECNRNKSDEIQCLLDDIYTELD